MSACTALHSCIHGWETGIALKPELGEHVASAYKRSYPEDDKKLEDLSLVKHPCVLFASFTSFPHKKQQCVMNSCWTTGHQREIRCGRRVCDMRRCKQDQARPRGCAQGAAQDGDSQRFGPHQGLLLSIIIIIISSHQQAVMIS